MQRNDARLNAEAGEEQQKHGCLPGRGQPVAQIRKAGEIQTAGEVTQNQESDQQAARTGVRHDKEQYTGAAGRFIPMLEADQAIGGQRHRLPGDQEEKRVRSGEDQRQAQQQKVIEKPEDGDRTFSLERAQVTEGINRYRRRQNAEDQGEIRRQRVKPETVGEKRNC